MTERHLRVVTPPLAGYPDSYTARRPGSDQAEAILSAGGGSWLVMYGFDAEASEPHLQWRATTTLPLLLDLAAAADYAVELAEAYDERLTQWHRLLAASMRAGEQVHAITALHAPFALREIGGSPYVRCAGDGGQFSPYWLACPTVRLLAGSAGVTLPPPPEGR